VGKSQPPDDATTRLIERARAAFAGGLPLLDGIGWSARVERAFFAAGCERAPTPTYDVDRDAAKERLARLDALERELRGDDALTRLLRARIDSHRLGAEMLLAIGTRRFSELSREAYGGARTSFLDGDTTNLDFAEHLASRLGSSRGRVDEDDASLDAAELATFVRERLTKRRKAPELSIVVDDELSAKVVAGKRRIRIRSDARFQPEEARSLYLHEVETHVVTAQNGDAQPHLDFLDSGGPRSTRTQEGLAVFAELYDKALTLERLGRLIERVRLVAMAEEGASFVDLYRHVTGQGVEPRSAYLDVARIFRGGLPAGGAPFTKDACYLSGLVEVYEFLRVAVTHDGRQLAEVLVSGRMAVEEVELLAALRDDGLLGPPTFEPGWLRRWDDLLVHFAFSSFLGEIDLAFAKSRHAWLEQRGSSMDRL
jgi:uncharacterized protein (TIGR02421 family)